MFLTKTADFKIRILNIQHQSADFSGFLYHVQKLLGKLPRFVRAAKWLKDFKICSLID